MHTDPQLTATRPGAAAHVFASPSASSLADTRRMLRTDERIVYRCGFDVLWCTQYRAPVITGQIEEKLKEVIAEVVEDKGALLTEMELSPQYVRMVVEISPKFGIHRLVKAIKARSANVLRAEFPSLRSRLPSLWTNSYLATTVGTGAPSSIVQKYVDEQKTR